jgi:hypothetical protein
MPIKPKEVLRCANCDRPISRYGVSSVDPANCLLCTPNAAVAGQKQVAGVSPMAVSARRKENIEAAVRTVQKKKVRAKKKRTRRKKK